METPLNARDFLRRFHLPQLVRVCPANEQPSSDESREVVSASTSTEARRFAGRDEQHERSEWKYRAFSRDQAVGGLGSWTAGSNDRQQWEEEEDDGDDVQAERQFHSVSACANRPNRAFRLPHAQLEKTKESVEFERLKDTQDAQLGVRLSPPSKRPALSKLSLDQPFLLYKAHKKLEVCTYVVDSKNELEEKSGDPIYFPENYTGWFSLLDASGKQEPLETVDQVCRSGAQMFITRDEIVAYQLPSRLSNLTKLKNNQLLALPLAINLDSLNQDQSRGKQREHSGSDINQMAVQAGQALKICGVYEDVLPLIEQNKQQQSDSKKRVSDTSYCCSTEQSHSIGQCQMAPPTGKLYHQMSLMNGQQHLYRASSLAPNSSYQIHQASQQTKPLRLPYGAGSSLEIDNKQQFLRQTQANYAAPPLIYAYQPRAVATSTASNPTGRVGKVAKGAPMQRKLQPSGQRYARCVVLNQQSVDRTTNCGTRNELADEEQEVEVLVPINQRGRFYLCAELPALFSQLNCFQCNVARNPHLVLTLSQIVALVNISRRLAGGAEWKSCGQNHGQQQTVDLVKQPVDGTRTKVLFKLPLTVQLVIGSRPANFSPSMFGSSLTMESYFRSETNIGGHSLVCKYNKRNIDASNISANSHSNKKVASADGSFICVCAQKLTGAMVDASHFGSSYSLFSAHLRIERIATRDVLLACTIKSDPLVHLDLFAGNQPCSCNDGGPQAQSDKQVYQQRNSRTVAYRDGRLGALKESSSRFNPNRDHQEQVKLNLKSSSFSRLRACRSLIGLNGGRKKRRPDIPSCMLDTSRTASCFTGPHPGGATVGGNDAGLSLSSGELVNNNHSIVLLEFDCNNTELKFVRTFVEGSIPTSTIPDLVLNRMDFCHKNSAEWERQLKLSYRVLSQDFDSCRRQLELDNRRNWQMVRVAPDRSTTRTTGSTTTPASHSANSTASSSRSSSGVSSAGDRDKRSLRRLAAGAANYSSGASSLVAASLVHSSISSSSNSTSASSSRLLRLVSRILPANFGHKRADSADGNAQGRSKDLGERQRLVMDELNGRFKREFALDNDGRVEKEEANNAATLMNAQKIHRKLLTGSLRHLPAELRDGCETSKKATNRAHGVQLEGGLNNSREQIDKMQEENDSGSHLYESLERVSVAKNANRRRADGSRVEQRDRENARVAFNGFRRRQLGRSMEFLSRFGGRRAIDSEEEEEEIEWWRNSTVSSTSEDSSTRRATDNHENRKNKAKGQGQPSSVDACTMEPVSIEACSEEFASVLEGYESSASELSFGLNAGEFDCDNGGKEEQVYVNLGPFISSLELDELRSNKRPLVSRMERKLMRMRGRRGERESESEPRAWSLSDGIGYPLGDRLRGRNLENYRRRCRRAAVFWARRRRVARTADCGGNVSEEARSTGKSVNSDGSLPGVESQDGASMHQPKLAAFSADGAVNSLRSSSSSLSASSSADSSDSSSSELAAAAIGRSSDSTESRARRADAKCTRIPFKGRRIGNQVTSGKLMLAPVKLAERPTTVARLATLDRR